MTSRGDMEPTDPIQARKLGLEQLKALQGQMPAPAYGYEYPINPPAVMDPRVIVVNPLKVMRDRDEILIVLSKLRSDLGHMQAGYIPPNLPDPNDRAGSMRDLRSWIAALEWVLIQE